MFEDLAEIVLRKGRELGAKFVDVRFEASDITRIVVSNGKILVEEVQSVKGAGIRVVYGEYMGFASTTDLTREGLERAVEQAFSMARACTGRFVGDFELSEVGVYRDRVIEEFRKDPREVNIEEKVRFLTEATVKMLKSDSRIKNATANYLDAFTVKAIANSEGTYIEMVVPRTRLYILAVAAEAGARAQSTERFASIAGYEYIESIPLDKAIKKVVETAVKMLKAEAPPSGRHTVIADPRLAGVFAHEALGHATEGDSVVLERSILAGRLGQKIGSECVTIIDDSTIPKAWGSFKYDDEGVPGTRKVLVENGVLKSYILDRYTAKKLGLKPNGGARAESFEHPPIVRMSNTFIAPGDWKLDELIQDTRYGILMKGSRGGEVNIVTGTFQFNAEEAYLVENGEITKPLKDVSLSGLTLETLSNVDAVTRELELDPGTCGKMGQGVPVTTGAPYVRIRNVLVGGGR